jgi:hypothetical protein
LQLADFPTSQAICMNLNAALAARLSPANALRKAQAQPRKALQTF